MIAINLQAGGTTRPPKPQARAGAASVESVVSCGSPERQAGGDDALFLGGERR
jgi:hypothetical protein